MNPNEVQEFYKVYLREILEEDSVKRDFVEVYPKLRENNELFIITARSNNFMDELFDMDTLTEAWLKRNDITYDGIFFNVYAEQKAMVCLKNNIDVLIDGPFILEKRNISLQLRGSSNQRILVKNSNNKFEQVNKI